MTDKFLCNPPRELVLPRDCGGLIIMALPGTGKTTLASTNPRLFRDTDDLAVMLFGADRRDDWDMTPENLMRWNQHIVNWLRAGKVVLTNTYMPGFNWPANRAHFAMVTFCSAGEYVKHVSATRRDLIQAYGPTQLVAIYDEFVSIAQEWNIPLVRSLTRQHLLTDWMGGLMNGSTI